MWQVPSMKCPYCAEDIADSAIVCKHCGRDFLVFRPLLEKIQVLEKEVANIRMSLSSFEGPPTQSLGSAEAASRPTRALSVSAAIVSLTCFGSIFFYWLALSGDLEYPGVVALAVAFPAFGGFAAGLSFRGRRVLLYSLLGFIIGLVDFAGTMMSYRGYRGHFAPDWAAALLVFVVGQLVLFLLAAIFSALTGSYFTSIGSAFLNPLGS